MKHDDLLWLAGLLEGEGCFYMRGRNRPAGLCVRLQMTDKDVVERAAALLDAKVYERGPRGSHSTIWGFWVGGPKAADIMARLLPLMGVRRSSKIQELLQAYNTKIKATGTNLGGRRKFEVQHVILIRYLRSRGIGPTKLAQMCNVSRETISAIVSRRTWAHVR